MKLLIKLIMKIKPRHPEKVNKPLIQLKKNQIGLDLKL